MSDRVQLRILRNQMSIMCFMIYGKEDARAKLALELSIKKTNKFLTEANEAHLYEGK